MKIPNFNQKETKDDEGNVVPPDSNQEILLNIFSVAVRDAYSKTEDTPQGKQKVSTLTGHEGRTWGRIQRKLDSAIEKNTKDVKFETAEVDFLKKAMEKAAFPILWFRYTTLVEEALEVKE